ncbi:MAG TPA: trehalose-6-phosphate synthase [Ilumatobacteraceae bacterium]|nr:trehalose-6-phosphate synthase [Ilumatobacteraceae bacterium]
MAEPALRDLVVIANRLPVYWAADDVGGGAWERSPGGLVSALEPAVAVSRTSWIGWTGSVGAMEPFRRNDIDLYPVDLTEDEASGFYAGFSNATLWPLYHDAIFESQFNQPWWDSYVDVNQRFATRAATVAPKGATVWVHDYHLQLVPQMLRDLRSDLRIGFFLHIPFPAQELFLRIPWREEIMRGLLGADVVGLQTDVGAQNFRQIAKRLLGRRQTRKHVLNGDRSTLVSTFPVGIAAAKIRQIAGEATTIERARQIRAELGEPRTVLLGVDRMDYTKGITIRLAAYRELLEEGRIDPSSVVLVQIAEPSRGEVPGYADVRVEVERLVGGINGDFGRLGGIAVKYLHQSQPLHELVALYLAADVMLVTPLRDGMNLVAKEYVASRLDGTGTLILSEFAGAAKELTGAVLINPFDIGRLKAAIEHAVASEDTTMARRMRAMARVVQRHDAGYWASSFLDALSTT